MQLLQAQVFLIVAPFTSKQPAGIGLTGSVVPGVVAGVVVVSAAGVVVKSESIGQTRTPEIDGFSPAYLS